MTNMRMWTTRDGRRIRIRDMSAEHIENTVAMLRRIHLDRVSEAFAFASSFNPDSMASYYADGMADQVASAESDHPLYDDLVIELERRRAAGAV